MMDKWDDEAYCWKIHSICVGSKDPVRYKADKVAPEDWSKAKCLVLLSPKRDVYNPRTKQFPSLLRAPCKALLWHMVAYGTFLIQAPCKAPQGKFELV